MVIGGPRNDEGEDCIRGVEREREMMMMMMMMMMIETERGTENFTLQCLRINSDELNKE